jgi:hypothetical protein
MMTTKNDKITFGDFQTPTVLAQLACTVIDPAQPFKTIIEPTCGKGQFLTSALKHFSDYEKAIGIEINQQYLAETATALVQQELERVKLEASCFFEYDWGSLLNQVTEPILMIGNPPWVTSATLGTLETSNTPKKSNFQNHKGINAITGNGNFDISEWMLLSLIARLNGKTGTLAMLCKTSVARKVLKYAWQQNYQLQACAIYGINAVEHFNANVDACFLVCNFEPNQHQKECFVYDSLLEKNLLTTLGLYQHKLVANVPNFIRYAYLEGKSSYTWRSGIKHDCASVMELTKKDAVFTNGLEETIELESTFVYPLLKSSDVYNKVIEPTRWMIVPQTFIGESTEKLALVAPKTWHYLKQHESFLNKRRSSIYNNKPLFSVFGLGAYSFAPWKVCISGLYKHLKFMIVGSYNNQPIVVDDTVYFIPCYSKLEAERLYACLTSEPATQFLSSLIFWDAKRPITAHILNSLNIDKLLLELGYESPQNQQKTLQLQFLSP